MKHITGRGVRACGLAIALYLGSTTAAFSGEVPAAAPGASDYQALGVPLGGFLLFPSLALTTTFDDNIRRTPTNTLADVFFSFRPNVVLRSQWSQHALNLTAWS